MLVDGGPAQTDRRDQLVHRRAELALEELKQDLLLTRADRRHRHGLPAYACGAGIMVMSSL